MATYYWSGTGTWDNSSTANWYNGTGGTGGNAPNAPLDTDTAILNAASGAGTCTVASTAVCAIVTLTGYTGTLDFGASGKITVTPPSATTVVTGGTTFSVTGTDPLIEISGGGFNVTTVMGSMTESNAISVSFLTTAGTKNATGSYRNLSIAGAVGAASPTIYGDLTFATGGSMSGSGATFTMAATSGTQTVTTNGTLIQRGFVVNAPGATVELGDSFDQGGPTRAFTLTAGTFNTNNHALSVGTFTSTGAATRTLGLGSSLVTVMGASWNCLSATNLTINAGTSTIFFSSTSVKTMYGGTGLTYYNIKNAGGAATLTVAGSAGSGSCSFNEWQADTLPCTYAVTPSYTQTLTNFPPSGTSAAAMFCITSATDGSQFTLSKASGTWNATHVYVRDCIFTGSATWNATNSADGGNNTGGSILYTGVARYWVGGSGTWDTTSTANWSATDGGASGASAPGPGDYAYFPSGTTGTVTLGADVTVSKWEVIGTPTFTFAFGTNKIICDWLGECFKTATGMTVTGTPRVDLTYAGGWSVGPSAARHGTSNGTVLEANTISMYITAGTALTGTPARFRTLDCTGFTGAIQGQFTRNIFGNVVYHSGMDPGGGTAVTTFSATSGVQEIYCGGATWNCPVAFNGVGAIFRFMDAFTNASTRAVTLTNGTLDANNFNVTLGTFSSSNSNVRTITMGSGTWTVTGTGASAWLMTTTTNLTFNPGTSTILMTGASAKTFTGGGLTYYNLAQGGAGALTIVSSNTFNDLTATYLPSTITVTAGTTQTFTNFTASGILNDALTINSTGSTYTFSKSSGTVAVAYIAITNCIGSGGATWTATYSTQTTCTNWSTTNTATTYYWVGSTGTWDNSTTTNWSLSSGGAGGAGYPNINDVAVIDASSGAGTITLGANVSCKTLTMTGFTGILAFGTNKISIGGANDTVYAGGDTFSTTGTSRLEFVYPGRTGSRVISSATTIVEANAMNIHVTNGIDIFSLTGTHRWGTLNLTGFGGTIHNTNKYLYGSLILSPTLVNMGGNQPITLAGSGSHTIDCAGFTSLSRAITVSGTGTYTLQSHFVNTTYSLALTGGTLDANGYNVTMPILSSSGSATRTLTMGSGMWTLTLASGNTIALSGSNLTVNKGTASIVLNGATGTNTIYTNGLTLYRLVISKPGTINFSTTASIFDYIENTTFPTAITISTTTMLTCNLGVDITGNSTNQSTLSSATPASIAYISAPTGVVVNPEYLTITDVGAMGGAKWDTYGNLGNIDGGNSPGWLWYQSNVDNAAFMGFF